MSVKTDGKTFQEFLNDDGYWGTKIIEEEVIYVNGNLEDSEFALTVGDHYHNNDQVEIVGGSVYTEDMSYVKDFIEFFNTWLTTRSHFVVTTSVPRELVEEFNAHVAEFFTKKGITNVS